jgi:hypothetical protein
VRIYVAMVRLLLRGHGDTERGSMVLWSMRLGNGTYRPEALMWFFAACTRGDNIPILAYMHTYTCRASSLFNQCARLCATVKKALVTSKICRPSLLGVNFPGNFQTYLQILDNLFVVFDSWKDVARVVKNLSRCGKGLLSVTTLILHKICRKLERDI